MVALGVAREVRNRPPHRPAARAATFCCVPYGILTRCRVADRARWLQTSQQALQRLRSLVVRLFKPRMGGVLVASFDRTEVALGAQGVGAVIDPIVPAPVNSQQSYTI